MSPDIIIIPFLQIYQFLIKCTIWFCRIIKKVCIFKSVSFFKPPVCQQIHVYINTFHFQTINQVIKSVDTYRIKTQGIWFIFTLCKLEDIWS